MVYDFCLPTTSHLSFQSYLTSSTHPSLPQSATIARHALRLALKKHKRLSARDRETHLQTVHNALLEYIPYLFTISRGLSGKPSACGTATGGVVDITLRDELEVEWRPQYGGGSKKIPGKRMTWVRGRGIDFEIGFVLSTLGYVLAGLARAGVLRMVYATTTATTEQRTAVVQNATRWLLQAYSVHTWLASSTTMTANEGEEDTTSSASTELKATVQTALASLALAEATLLAILKDDAYMFACVQARNPHDKEWMVKAPEIPKVRASIFARLCVRSAEYAEQAAAGLTSASVSAVTGARGKVDEDLIKYTQTLGKVARARACRFLAIDAEMGGKTGEGIAWLRAARAILGLRRTGDFSSSSPGAGSQGGSTLSRLRKGWAERREERKLEKTSPVTGELPRGDDAGCEEEGRVIEMLETKWTKINDTVSSFLVPIAADVDTERSSRSARTSSRRPIHCWVTSRPGETFTTRRRRTCRHVWMRTSSRGCGGLRTTSSGSSQD